MHSARRVCVCESAVYMLNQLLLLQVLLNVFMVVDIFARMCTLGMLFWRHWYNIADVMVMVLCVIATGYFVHFHGMHIADASASATAKPDVMYH